MINQAEKAEAEEIAREIRASGLWDDRLNYRLCELAGMGEAYRSADAETFETVVYSAAERLGVSVI